MRCRYRDASRFFFRRIIYLVIRSCFSSVCLRQYTSSAPLLMSSYHGLRVLSSQHSHAASCAQILAYSCVMLLYKNRFLIKAHNRNRTGDLFLTKEVLYRLSYVGAPARMERAMGIEPTLSAWKAEVLPLNYARVF